MDAPDEKDVALQRAASDLIDQFKSFLPRFLWHTVPLDQRFPEQGQQPRNIIRTATTLDLIKLLEPFQEWPQLLDPELSNMLMPLVETFAASLSLLPDKYYSCPARLISGTFPLPRAICKLLYTFCKIRSPKVISRFFKSEPMYIELMLNALHARTRLRSPGKASGAKFRLQITWEERYIMLLWLSHLSLTPFDLSSMGSISPMKDESVPVDLMLPSGISSIAQRLLSVGLAHINSVAKEREAAVTLLVRLVLRHDMARIGLLDTLVTWSIGSLKNEAPSSRSQSIYRHIGILSFLASTVNLADVLIIAPFLLPIFHCMQRINATTPPTSSIILSSAVARKVIIKVLRSISVKALQLEVMPSPESPSIVDVVIEDVIQQLLSWLADKDTQVRFAASKALSVITLNLPSSMANEVIEAIIAALEDKIIWVEGETGMLEERRHISTQRDLSAVDGLEWQGLVLALSHLLFRRCPSLEQLPAVLNALIMALNFEQRTSSRSSTGTSVRDAACFGIWSLARRYTTDQLLAMDRSAIKTRNPDNTSVSVLQAVADELVIASIADPSGNIRRGASAALQELIGRHPDSVIHGIDVVQVVDYHAVALRSKALKEVAISVAEVDKHYWHVTLRALLSWRAIDATDSGSRRHASQALGDLSTMESDLGFLLIAHRISDDLKRLEGRQVEKRHGLLLAAGAVLLKALHINLPESRVEISLAASEFWDIFDRTSILEDKYFSSSLLRPPLTAEGCCSLISSLASITSNGLYSSIIKPSTTTITRCANLIDLSLLHTQDTVISNTSEAAKWLLPLMDGDQQAIILMWIAKLLRKKSLSTQSADNVCGQIAVLGSVYPTCNKLPILQSKILDSILGLLEGKDIDIDSKVGCLKCLSKELIPCKVFDTRVATIILNCLQNYTIDQRGDVGSLVRFEAIVAVHNAHRYSILDSATKKQELVAQVCRLAAEKLDRIRFRAWQCLEDIFHADGDIKISLTCSDIGQVSSVSYYLQLVSLSSIQWLRQPLLQGMVTSAAAGSETILCASRAAMVKALEGMPLNELTSFWGCLLITLKSEVHNERLVISVLEVLGFVLASGIYGNTTQIFPNWRQAFFLVQKSHYKSGNLHRLRAAIDVYVGLSRVPVIRKEVLCKLASMLLHPSANVRNKAAESLYMVTENSNLDMVDWSQSPSALKATVRQFQETLKAGP